MVVQAGFPEGLASIVKVQSGVIKVGTKVGF